MTGEHGLLSSHLTLLFLNEHFSLLRDSTLFYSFILFSELTSFLRNTILTKLHSSFESTLTKNLVENGAYEADGP